MVSSNVIGQQTTLIAGPGVLERFTPLAATGTPVDGYQPPVDASDTSVANAFAGSAQPGIVMMHTGNPFKMAHDSVSASLLARKARTDGVALVSLIERAKNGDDFAKAQLKKIDLSQLKMGFAETGRFFVCGDVKELVAVVQYSNQSAFVKFMQLAIEELELKMQGHTTLGALMHFEAFEGMAVMASATIGKRDDYKELVKKNIGPIFAQAYEHEDPYVRAFAHRILNVIRYHTCEADFWRYAGVKSNDIQELVQTANHIGSVEDIRKLDVLHELNYADQFTTRSAIQSIDPMTLISRAEGNLNANIDALDILIKHGNVKARNGLIRLLQTYEFDAQSNSPLDKSLLAAAKFTAFWEDLVDEIESGSTAALAKYFALTSSEQVQQDSHGKDSALAAAIANAKWKMGSIDARELVTMIRSYLHVMKDSRRASKKIEALTMLATNCFNEGVLAVIAELSDLLPQAVSEAMVSIYNSDAPGQFKAYAYGRLLGMASKDMKEGVDGLYQIADASEDDVFRRTVIGDLSWLAVNSPYAARTLMIMGGLNGGAYDGAIMDGLMKLPSRTMLLGLSKYLLNPISGKCESCDDRVKARNDFMRKFLPRYEAEVLGAV